LTFNRLFRLSAITLGVIGLFGCASDNSPKPQPMPKIDNEVNLKSGWSQNRLTPSDTPVRGGFVPVSQDSSIIYVADAGNNIYKLDGSDGSIIKDYDYPFDDGEFQSGVAVSAQNVFVTTTKGKLIAIDKVSGNVSWTSQLPTLSIEAPQVAKEIVVVRTNDAEILAFDAATGKTLWIYQKPIPPLTVRAHNTFSIIAGEVVAVGLPGGKLALLNLFTGIPIWENYVAIPTGSTDLDKLTDVTTRPVIDERLMCVATFNGKIACMDAFSSNIIWQKPFSSSQGLVIDQQNVYAVSQDSVVYAFDKMTGSQVWSNDTMQYRGLGAPALLANGVVAVDKDGYVHMFNRNDGHEMARYSSSMQYGTSVPLSMNNTVYYQSNSGNISQISTY
jgi:outer membrane protein assembly factor BamB